MTFDTPPPAVQLEVFEVFKLFQRLKNRPIQTIFQVNHFVCAIVKSQYYLIIPDI